MRNYAKIFPAFWTGKTGKRLRGDPNAQIVAMHLISGPHANMIGVYHCPTLYIAHETGLSVEGAARGLDRLVTEKSCTYDQDQELVWVHEMARFQIGDAPKATDKQVKGVQTQFAQLADGPLKAGFWRRYRHAFHLGSRGENARGFQGASKTLGSQEQEQEHEQAQYPSQEAGISKGEYTRERGGRRKGDGRTATEIDDHIDDTPFEVISGGRRG